MIKLIEKRIHEYMSVNNVYRNEMRIYIHPTVKRYLVRELHATYTNYVMHPNDDITIMSVRVVEGYDLKNIVIASPSLYNREPLLINIDLLINL